MSSGRWFAPGRVNLIGEHTDYNGGYVLPIALDLGTGVEIRLRDDDRVVLSSAHPGAKTLELRLDQIVPGADLGWAAYPAGVAWAAADAGLPVRGFEAHYSSNLPVGAGLSSSAAIGCATALALSDLLGWAADRHRIAALARTSENVIAGAPTGVMDQLASTFGERDHALLIATDSLGVTPTRFDPASAGLALMVIDSHTPHALVDGEYAARRRSCEQAAEAIGVEHLCSLTPVQWDAAATEAGLDGALLRRARHVVSDSARAEDVARILCSTGDFTEIGRLFNESHESMRVDYEITAPTVDLIQRAAVDAGALGARMTGGGFGGSVIALVDQDAVSTVLAACVAASARAGHPEPTAFVAHPGDGARRVG